MGGNQGTPAVMNDRRPAPPPSLPTTLTQVEPLEAESGIQVFPVNTAPYNSVSIPISVDALALQVPANEEAGTVADQILNEAQRVAASGDVQGQITLLQQAGSMGKTDAYYQLAKIYLNGVGVPKASDVAIGYLNTAMGLGHAESARVLGWLYVMGSSVDKDVEYGKSLLEQASETSVRAQREYGMALTNQRIPNLNDMERGLELLKAAAAAGDTEADNAYRAAFSPSITRSVPDQQVAWPASEMSRRAPHTEPRQSVFDGGTSLKQRALAGDLSAMYQYALNISLRKIPDAEPEFKSLCFFTVASERGYNLAGDEVRALAGVRKLSDKESPGRMDRCIDDLNATLDRH